MQRRNTPSVGLTVGAMWCEVDKGEEEMRSPSAGGLTLREEIFSHHHEMWNLGG